MVLLKPSSIFKKIPHIKRFIKDKSKMIKLLMKEHLFLHLSIQTYIILYLSLVPV